MSKVYLMRPKVYPVGPSGEVIVEAISEKEALKALASQAFEIKKMSAADVLATAGKVPVITAPTSGGDKE